MIDVESVATDDDLTTYTLGRSNLNDIIPEDDGWLASDGVTKTAKPARAQVLKNVLSALAKRRPPIREEMLVDPSELNLAVCYGTLEILYRGAIQHEDSPNIGRAKSFGQMYASELNSLQPSTRSGSTAGSLSIRISRG